MEAAILPGRKPLNLERYEGTTDPNEHLEAFLTQANLYTNDDAILCHVFPMSLKGMALTWYSGLPPRSRNSFDTLVERFNVQYATSRSHHMTSTALASLRQVDDESLCKFMDKFGRIVIQIQNLNQEVELHSMLLTLRSGKFANSLCKKPLVSWTRCANEPKATFRWKKCSDSVMKSDKPDKCMTSEKEAPRPTHTSRTRGTSRTSAGFSQKGTGTSITHP